MQHLLPDPALPHLDEILVPAGAPEEAARLASETSGAVVSPAAARTRYVRYRPGRDLVVLWAFPTVNGRPVLVSGKVFGDDRGADLPSRDSFRRQAARARVATPSGAPMHAHVAQHRLLLQAYPLDFRLPGLLVASTDAWLDRALGGEPGAATLLEAQPVSYKPWLRCVLRYSVEIEGRERRFFGKVFREHPGPDTEATLRTLGERLEATGSPWRIAAPVRYLAPERLLVFEAPAHDVDLQTLLETATEDAFARRRLLAAVARAAAGLVAFQEADVTGVGRLDPASMVARLERRSKRFARVAPTFRRLFADRLAILAAEADGLDPEPTALTHGAFRHEHVVLSEDQLVILDLDGFALAGASSDAGSFLAYLDVTALRSPALRRVVSECQDAFLSTLERETHVRDDWLTWYRSVAQLKWTLDAAASLDPHWPELVDALLGPSTTRLAVGTP